MTKWDELWTTERNKIVTPLDLVLDGMTWLEKIKAEGDRLQEKSRLWEKFYEIARQPESMDDIMEFIVNNIPQDEH